ncbi:hypothetical protein [Nocardiopsis deserti]|uniref:hypothetical protein n=1 Tax=Nocardiopsis deserti TaxID=2605988 RepID=UPI00123B9883|nr:hypothetical protein [Nocardiopsis deserti]
MMSATTAVPVTDLTCDDVRLCREANGSGSLASLAVAACHVDLSPGWSTHGRAARIAALEKLARLASQAAHELREADQRQGRKP